MSFTMQQLDNIKKAATEVSEREGCLLYDVEVAGGGSGRVLRVYIDRFSARQDDDEASPVGANIDDCANVSRGLSLLLDVEELVPGGAYELEVSTPGLDRQLKEAWHFENAIGKNIQVSTNTELTLPEGYTAKKPLKNVSGELLSVTEDRIEIKSGEWHWLVPFSSIHKAKVKTLFQHPGSPKAPKAKNKKKR